MTLIDPAGQPLMTDEAKKDIQSRLLIEAFGALLGISPANDQKFLPEGSPILAGLRGTTALLIFQVVGPQPIAERFGLSFGITQNGQIFAKKVDGWAALKEGA